MANAVHHSVLGSCFVAAEALFGVSGSFVRCFPVADTVELTTSQNPLDVKVLQARPWNTTVPVNGLKSATFKGTFYLQTADSPLGDGTSAPAAADVPTFTFLSALWGAVSVAGGSTVASSSGASSLVVDTGHGARFPTGAWFAVEDPDGTSGVLPCRVTERSTDTLTFWPSLSGAADSAAEVFNGHTFYPTRQNAAAVSVRVASAQDSAQQFQCIGGTGTMELSLARGELATMTLDLQFASHTGPEALGYSTADAQDPMAAPMSCRGLQVLFQDPTTATRATVDLDAVTLKLNLGMKHLETLGGTEGVRGVYRAEGVTDAFCEAELTFPSNTTWESDWADGNPNALVLLLQVDTAGGRRMIVVDLPRVCIVGKPRHVKGNNGLAATVLTVRTMLDQNYSGTPDTPQLAEAPMRLAFIPG